MHHHRRRVCAAVLIGLAFELDDRPQYHAAARGLAAVMKRFADGDTSASIPATDREGRDWCDGPDGHRIPRQHDRAPAAERRARRRQIVRREQRSEAISATIVHFEQTVDAGAGQSPRARRSGWKATVDQPQRRGRRGFGAGSGGRKPGRRRFRRTSPPPPARSRSLPPPSARSPAAGLEIHRRGRSRRVGGSPHRSRP